MAVVEQDAEHQTRASAHRQLSPLPIPANKIAPKTQSTSQTSEYDHPEETNFFLADTSHLLPPTNRIISPEIVLVLPTDALKARQMRKNSR